MRLSNTYNLDRPARRFASGPECSENSERIGFAHPAPSKKRTMLPRVAVVFFVVFAVAVFVAVAMLGWAMASGTAGEDRFFDAVATGKPEEVLALMHPALQQEIDPPVLDAWMKEINQTLGKYQALSKADFQIDIDYDNGVKVVKTKGTVHFERGDAVSDITYRDDRIVKFLVRSDALPPGWFKGVADSTLYRRRGEEFLRNALDGRPEKAFALMHAALQKKMPLATLKPALQHMAAKTGKLESIAYDREEFRGGAEGESLTVHYKIATRNGPVRGRVEFQFIGLQGHITAFNATQE